VKLAALRARRAAGPNEGSRAFPGAEKVSLAALSMLRGYLEGLPLDDLIARYMPPRDDGERGDRWAAYAAMEVTRGALVRAARRSHDRRSTRLLTELKLGRAGAAPSPPVLPALPPQNLDRSNLSPAVPERPDFDSWLESQSDAEDFSLEEMKEVYEAQFGGIEPPPPPPPTPASVEVASPGAAALPARAFDKALVLAINDLALRVTEEPAAEHALGPWLGEGIARRLAAVGVVTLAQLHEFMREHGYRWWTRVDRMGSVSAERVQAWFRQHRAALRLDLPLVVTHGPRSPELRAERAQAPSSTGIVPYERYRPPALPHLTGEHGENRGRGPRSIRADTDIEAMTAWLMARAPDNANTFRAYRREAERLLLWCHQERGMAISSMLAEDCAAYLAFLKAVDTSPQFSAWVGPIRERTAPDWKPFQGKLSDRSVRQAQVILNAMFQFMWQTGYLANNPFAANARVKLRFSAEKIQVNNALPEALVKEVDAQLAARCEGHDRKAQHWRVLRAVFYLGVDCGLRREEIAMARRDQLEYAANLDTWRLTVIGKGGKERTVYPEPRLIDALRAHAADRELDLDQPGVGAAGKWPLLSPVGRKFEPAPDKDDLPEHQGYHPGAIHNLTKEISTAMQAWATEERPELAERAGRFRTHALRHTFGTRAAADLPAPDVQKLMGHASLSTTSIYINTEEEALVGRLKKRRSKSAGEKSAES
jgi:integrase